MDDLYERLLELCERRKSRRTFTGRPVPDGVIEKIVRVAKTSPYASGKNSWDIVAIKDREALGKIAEIVRSKARSISESIDDDYREGFGQYSSNFTFFENAPAVFFLSFRLQKSVSLMVKRQEEGSALYSEIVEWERDNLVKSISCAAMLVLLAAESLGLSACYMTGPLIAEKEIAEYVKIKKGRSLGAIIPIGYYEKQKENE